MNILMIAIVFALVIFTLVRILKQHQFLKREIAQKEDEVIRMEKLASLGQLSAIIAHEIKNPLNFVINFSEGADEVFDDVREDLNEYKSNQKPEVLKRLMDNLDELKTTNQYILSNGHRVGKIINHVMDQSQNSKKSRQSIQVNKFIEEQVRLACEGFKLNNTNQSILLDQSYDPSIPSVLLNPQDFGRVVINLVTNACYALDQKSISASNDFKPTIQIRTKLIGSQVNISILDNGPGIDPEILPHIFSPFFTSKPHGHGNSGLGLALSKEIVSDRIGGTIEVESKLEKYTNFMLKIPIR